MITPPVPVDGSDVIPVAFIYHNVGFINLVPVSEPESQFGQVENLIGIDDITFLVFEPFSLAAESQNLIGSMKSGCLNSILYLIEGKGFRKLSRTNHNAYTD